MTLPSPPPGWDVLDWVIRVVPPVVVAGLAWVRSRSPPKTGGAVTVAGAGPAFVAGLATGVAEGVVTCPVAMSII